jgi:hypothetical protein
MLLHVIWGFVEDVTQECPTFSVSGMLLHWADRAPAYVKQSRFRWRDEAWEAAVEVSRGGSTSPAVSGVLRLNPKVWQTWIRQSVNPRREAARQLHDVMHARGWTSDLGVINLTS